MPLLSILVGLAIWICLFWFLGIPTLAKQRMVLFVLGFIFPLLWAFGALMPARGE